MSQQWSILVVEGDEALNRSIVGTLLKDGYNVRGVATGGEAIRILWVDEQHLVISDRTLPDADGFDLLQWIRTYRPSTRMMMLAAANARGARTQALENGAVAYLEKPLDLRLLKVEVRRLLQQSGFTASLSSFDLLDVIQIINMSRKSIALVVHTGLEEQGLLGFKAGELTWAEYGFLRGEEAFFALAAYKNGTVTQQLWNDAVTPNVTQSLSRLIMQALQYRSKYASAQQLSGEFEAVSNHPTVHSEEELDTPFDTLLTEMPDDRPFVFVAEEAQEQQQAREQVQAVQPASAPLQAAAKEWWQESAKVRRVEQAGPPVNGRTAQAPRTSTSGDTPASQQKSSGTSNGASITPSTVRKTTTGQRPDLPSWLMDQPTQFEIKALRPSSLTSSSQVPATPVLKPSAEDRQPSQMPASTETPAPVSGPVLQSLAIPRTTDELAPPSTAQPGAPLSLAPPPQRKRNYPALVAAMQTLGYSLPGFVASAIVSMDGQPIAQVAIDELDIAGMCPNFSIILRTAMHCLDEGNWERHEDTIITSATHHILLRVLGNDGEAFQALITTRESDPVESLDVMANVEGAIISAL